MDIALNVTKVEVQAALRRPGRLLRAEVSTVQRGGVVDIVTQVMSVARMDGYRFKCHEI
jgi:hypothetical protein